MSGNTSKTGKILKIVLTAAASTKLAVILLIAGITVYAVKAKGMEIYRTDLSGITLSYPTIVYEYVSGQ